MELNLQYPLRCRNHLIGTFCIVNSFLSSDLEFDKANLIGTFCIVNYSTLL